MKSLLLFFLPALFMIAGNKQLSYMYNPTVSYTNSTIVNKEAVTINFQDKQEPGKMLSKVFKLQEYCRAEMPPDFEFEASFKVISATVYFSGTNFRNVERGTINSNSLKPVKEFMDRCAPGSIVVFDDVKVIGPDKVIRSIPGMSLMLY